MGDVSTAGVTGVTVDKTPLLQAWTSAGDTATPTLTFIADTATATRLGIAGTDTEIVEPGGATAAEDGSLTYSLNIPPGKSLGEAYVFTVQTVDVANDFPDVLGTITAKNPDGTARSGLSGATFTFNAGTDEDDDTVRFFAGLRANDNKLGTKAFLRLKPTTGEAYTGVRATAEGDAADFRIIDASQIRVSLAFDAPPAAGTWAAGTTADYMADGVLHEIGAG